MANFYSCEKPELKNWVKYLNRRYWTFLSLFAVKTRVEKLNRLFHILKIIGKKTFAYFLRTQVVELLDLTCQKTITMTFLDKHLDYFL